LFRFHASQGSLLFRNFRKRFHPLTQKRMPRGILFPIRLCDLDRLLDCPRLPRESHPFDPIHGFPLCLECGRRHPSPSHHRSVCPAFLFPSADGSLPHRGSLSDTGSERSTPAYPVSPIGYFWPCCSSR